MHPLVSLMRRYSYAYTASHDFSVLDELMVPDYELWMGDSRVTGREENYRPATARVYEEFPGLGFVVHELLCSGERIALRFSEHGRSVTRGGSASWSGVSLYRWDGKRLQRCLVEQDYWSRREQLHKRSPYPIEPPGMDPWTSSVEPRDVGIERAAREWLGAGGALLEDPDAILDNEWCAPAARVRIDGPSVRIDDIFSAGERVAFHVTLEGPYAGGLPVPSTAVGTPVRIAASGFMRVHDGSVCDVRAVTGRLAVFRSLSAGDPAGRPAAAK